MQSSKNIEELKSSEKNVQAINGLKFMQNGCEYRVRFHGGLGAYISVDKRESEQTNFRHHIEFDALNCWSAKEALEQVFSRIS